MMDIRAIVREMVYDRITEGTLREAVSTALDNIDLGETLADLLSDKMSEMVYDALQDIAEEL